MLLIVCQYCFNSRKNYSFKTQ